MTSGRVNIIVPLTPGVTHVEAGMPLRALLAAKAAVTGRTLAGPPIFTDMPHKQGDTHAWWVASADVAPITD